MNVVVKRVYVAASPSDGVRVLVDRLWPRGLKKEDAAVKFWLRELAPSNELRQWFHANPEAWRMFRKRYLKELVSEKGAAAVEKLPWSAIPTSASSCLRSISLLSENQMQDIT